LRKGRLFKYFVEAENSNIMRMPQTAKTAIVFGISIFLHLMVLGLNAGADQNYGLDPLQSDEINMLRGDLVSVKVSSLTRVSVADPDVADIADATDQEVLLIGHSIGQTALFIWDEQGKRTIMVYVFNQSLDIVKSRMEKLFKIADIFEVKTVTNEQEGKVVVSGEIPDYKQDQYDQIIMTFADDVIDLAREEEINDLVQIDMQITEMNTSVTKSLGIDWFTGTQTLSDGTLTTTFGTTFNPVYGEILPSLTPGIKDLLKVGDFRRSSSSALVAQISALITEGKARVLSNPKLVVVSGEEAKFLVGGEIPIRTTTISDSGSSQENVSFKEFGVSMTITPTIKRG